MCDARSPSDAPPPSRARAEAAAAAAAAALWDELQRGEWPGVDGFVIDGRRFVVARRGGPLLRWSALSPREREIVARAAEGASNKAIADALGLATSTVGVHLARAIRKVGAPSRAALLCAFLLARRSP